MIFLLYSQHIQLNVMNWLSYDRAAAILACFMRPANLDHPFWILLIAAGIAGAAGWLILKVMTDQREIKQLNRKIIASGLELVIYRHDVAIQIKAAADMLKGIGISARKILPAAIVAAIPFLLALMMLESFFNGRPLKPGESAIFKVTLSPEFMAADQSVTLKGSGDIAIETPALRVPAANEMNWRFRIKEGSPAPSWLELTVRGTIKRRQVSVKYSRLPQAFTAMVRQGEDNLKRMTGSASDPVILATTITYPPRELILAGFRINWLVAFLLMTIGSTCIFKRCL